MSKNSLQVSGEATVESCFSGYIGKCEMRNLSDLAPFVVNIRFPLGFAAQ